MTTEFSDSIKKIVWALRRIVGLVYQDSKKMNKRFGITGPQSLVIKILYSSDKPLSSVTLSRSLYVTPANITGIIDRLEEKGIVKRIKRQDDRRQNMIELTEQGKKYGEELPDFIEEKLMQGLANLGPTEIYGIYSALNSIIDIIGVKEGQETILDHE